MQSLLFLLEEADAQLRDGKPHLALKKYMAVKMVSSPLSILFCFVLMPLIQVFDEIDDDQFDFHGYNLRKFTISIYLKYVLSLRS
jgi:N-alpha-acetyltransferase 15/16, NatA auxiliary subunit